MAKAQPLAQNRGTIGQGQYSDDETRCTIQKDLLCHEHTEPRFAPAQLVFVETSALLGSFNTVEGMAQASYNKLWPRKAGPFRVIDVHPHTVVIGDGGVPNTVSIHRVKAALGLEEYPITVQTPSSCQNDIRTTQNEQNEKALVRSSKVSTSSSEYAAGSIVRQKGRDWNRKCIISWYG